MRRKVAIEKVQGADKNQDEWGAAGSKIRFKEMVGRGAEKGTSSGGAASQAAVEEGCSAG